VGGDAGPAPGHAPRSELGALRSERCSRAGRHAFCSPQQASSQGQFTGVFHASMNSTGAVGGKGGTGHACQEGMKRRHSHANLACARAHTRAGPSRSSLRAHSDSGGLGQGERVRRGPHSAACVRLHLRQACEIRPPSGAQGASPEEVHCVTPLQGQGAQVPAMCQAVCVCMCVCGGGSPACVPASCSFRCLALDLYSLTRDRQTGAF